MKIADDVWMFADTCNIYVLKTGASCIAIDFGSGEWLKALDQIGVRSVDHVFMTHHHDDQCQGLLEKTSWPFQIHAPLSSQAGTLLPKGIANVHYDMEPWRIYFANDLGLQLMATPGHGPDALSIIVEFHGRQIALCGDAVHAGGTVWLPYNLEWDHYTGKGALAAWAGIEKLRGLQIDLLCPSHGPVIEKDIAGCLKTLSDRLMALYRAKEDSACPGEPDHLVIPKIMRCGARQYLPQFYQYGENSYLLVSDSHQAIVVDPSVAGLQPLLDELAELQTPVKPRAILITHEHGDHCGDVGAMRKKFGVATYLHPRVAQCLLPNRRLFEEGPPGEQVPPVYLWPDTGTWTWNEYTFDVSHWPGQTWAHCVFQTTINGQKVLFGGDTFKRSCSYSGTGAFYAGFNARFQEGFIESARLAIRWRPDIVADGHRMVFRFTESRFQKFIDWARRAETAVKDLCPSGDLEKDYYSRPHNPQH